MRVLLVVAAMWQPHLADGSFCVQAPASLEESLVNFPELRVREEHPVLVGSGQGYEQGAAPSSGNVWGRRQLV